MGTFLRNLRMGIVLLIWILILMARHFDELSILQIVFWICQTPAMKLLRFSTLVFIY